MRLATVLTLLVLLAGCRTAKGVYTDAMALETAGQPEPAALAYADALRRDPTLPNAAGRLRVAGNDAVALRLASAAGQPTRSATADDYLAAEALVRQASAVGVSLDRPAAFAQEVAAACSAAVDALLDAGRSRAEGGDPAAGLTFLDRARTYRPSAGQRAGLDAAARDAYAGWAAQNLTDRSYRAALGHADQGLALAEPGSEAAAVLAALRVDILDRGTLVAAVFPATPPRTPRGDAFPRDFLRDVSDVLLDDRLAQPAPFLLLADPADVRRALRQSRGDLAGNPRLLADLTRSLDADVGVMPELDGFAFTEAETGRRDVTFRLRAGEGSAAAVRVTTEMTLRARATVVATYADGTRLACPSDAASVSVLERYDTATTAAALETLRLSASERELFGDAPRDHAYSRLVAQLRDRLADRLAERISACLAAQVP